VSAGATQRVTVGDIEVAYRRAGAPDGTPVVLVHGLAEDSGSWHPVQEALDDRATFAYDLRGHGESTVGEGDGTLRQLGEDLIGFLETVTGPAACVGFSLGGTIVLWAAAERPDLVARTVVLGTSSVVGRAATGFYDDRIALARSGDRDALLTALTDDTRAGLSSAADVPALARRRMAAVGAGEGYVNAATAMMRMHEQPLTPRLAEIHAHVDVVGGERDAFCPRKAADMLLGALPDATYHEIPGAGHLMVVDEPEAVIRTLRTTLDRGETA
jgi:pimeloyl-ACP methyl ester carboxylesterase